MEQIKDIANVRPENPNMKVGRPRKKLTGEELKQHLKEMRAKQNKNIKSRRLTDNVKMHNLSEIQ